jgi:prepilin signal peptidase PulO-like enzyme (type II secretory pathway)
MSKTRIYGIAAWHSFIAPLAGVLFFVLWNKADLVDWISPKLPAPLLFFVFSSALILALITIFAPRDIVARPVREIAWLGAVVSSLLLGMLTLVVSHSQSSRPTIVLEATAG